MSQDKIESRRAFMKKRVKSSTTWKTVVPYMTATVKDPVFIPNRDSIISCFSWCRIICKESCSDVCSSCGGCDWECTYREK